MELPKLSVEVKPSQGIVAVIPESREEVTASGIIIPDTAGEKKSSIGFVYAVGSGEDKDGFGTGDYMCGDRVVFGMYAGDEIELEDKDGKKVKVKFLEAGSIKSIIS